MVRTPHAPTVKFVEQAARVSELLDAGYSNRRIAEVLGVSAPRVSQIRRQLPTVEPYLGAPDPLGRLRGHREQLADLRRQALSLASQVRRDLRTGILLLLVFGIVRAVPCCRPT